MTSFSFIFLFWKESYNDNISPQLAKNSSFETESEALNIWLNIFLYGLFKFSIIDISFNIEYLSSMILNYI